MRTGFWVVIAMMGTMAAAVAQEPGAAQRASDRFFTQYDRNRDGKLSREEFPKRARPIFERVDANGDGVVTREEDRAFRERWIRRRAERAPARKSAAPDHADLSYGPHERNVLDLWFAKGEGARPLVVHFHGGGFRGGDKGSLNPALLQDLLDRGISVASANYRLTDTAPFPAQMHDAARAIQFLRLNAGKYGIDPGRIAATGGSAGAGISLWLAFHDDLADPESEDPLARQSTRLTSAAVVNGQTSYDPRFIARLFDSEDVEGALIALFGMESASDVSDPAFHPLFEEASPIHHLSKDDVPVLLVYRQPDDPVPPGSKASLFIHHPRFGRVLKEKMDELEIPCTLALQRDKADVAAFFSKSFGLEAARKAEPRRTLPEGVEVHRDLVYAEVGDESLRLDLYLPTRSDSKPPLLVWIHGGGWTNGSKAGISPVFVGLTGEGYAAASVDYRLTGLDSHPDQTHDVKGAIRWLRAHADEYGYDPARIGVGGGSAGGHLVLMLGMTAGVEELEGEVGGNLSFSSRVQAVVDLFGPSDFVEFAKVVEHLGRRLSPELQAAASPLAYVTKDDAPVLILHGDRDPLVPVSQSRLVNDRLSKEGVEATLHVIEGAGHGGREFSDDETYALVKAFLDRHLRCEPAGGEEE